jgi:integrase/recombinase XerD
MKNKLPIAVEEEDFVKLIQNTKKEEHKLAFLLGYGSGMRVSEIVNLKPEDVNFKEKRILIKEWKGGKDRVVPLPKGFKEKHMGMLPLKMGPRALQIAFKSACRRARLIDSKPDIHFHSLRHGFGSQMAKNGVPIHYIRTLMGHSNISTTNVYLQANPEDALKSYEELF